MQSDDPIRSFTILSLELPARSPRHGAAPSEPDALEPSLALSVSKPSQKPTTRFDPDTQQLLIIWFYRREEGADIYPRPNLRLSTRKRIYHEIYTLSSTTKKKKWELSFRPFIQKVIWVVNLVELIKASRQWRPF